MASQPPTTDRQSPSRGDHDCDPGGTWIDRVQRLALTVFGVLVFAAMPAAAQSGTELVEQIGTDAGSSGGGAIAFVVWFLLMVALIFKGLGRIYTAVDHMGSLHDDQRTRGREEVKYGGITFLAGLIGVPVAATFVGRILPDSWSWIGVDLTQFVSLPGGDGGGGGTIYVPVGETMDAAMVILPALV